MTERLDRCALCQKIKPLALSHIIPNSFIKKVRRGSPQLVVIRTDDSIPKYDNANPREKMLCSDCEQYFSSAFENYGISLLRRSKNIVKGNKNVVVYNYDYKRFYLYCLSIFWRMAKSNLIEFKDVTLPENILDAINHCLLNNTIHFKNEIRIDNFINIDVVRVYDPKSDQRTYLLSNILCPCHIRHNQDEYKVSFFAEGLFYTLSINLDLKQININKGLSRGQALKFKRVDYRSIDDLRESIHYIFNKARQHSNI